MTYIKVDSNFVEIDILSRLLELSREQIEKVIDLGYAGPSSDDIDTSIAGVNDLVAKIRLGSYLVSLGMSDDVTLDVYRNFGNGSEYTRKLDSYFESGALGLNEYEALKAWH